VGDEPILLNVIAGPIDSAGDPSVTASADPLGPAVSLSKHI